MPGILRDDRNALAYRHNLAVAWYGPYFTSTGASAGNTTNTSAATQRRAASWSMHDCCFLPTFLDADGTEHDHPKLGYVATTLAANGQSLGLKTPFSFMEYVHESGTSSIVTDWADLEFER